MKALKALKAYEKQLSTSYMLLTHLTYKKKKKEGKKRRKYSHAVIYSGKLLSEKTTEIMKYQIFLT